VVPCSEQKWIGQFRHFEVRGIGLKYSSTVLGQMSQEDIMGEKRKKEKKRKKGNQKE